MKYVRKIVNDYCVVDLETTGLSAEFDEIIELAALKIKGNEIVSKYQQLVKPTYEIDEFITELTGITNDMVADQPSIDEAIQSFLDFIEGETIVGHNTSFDIQFIQKAAKKELNNEYIDTLQLARKVYPDLKHHRLKDMAKYLQFDYTAHRALGDCEATFKLYKDIGSQLNSRGVELSELFYNKRKSDYNYDLQAEGEIDENNFFFDKHVVFTGKLDKMARKDAMQLVVNAGGVLDKTVTKSTNYLVLGNNDYVSSIKDGKSTKQKKAEKYILSGCDLSIIDEVTFYRLIGVPE